MQPGLTISRTGAELLLEVFSQRYDVTTNLPFSAGCSISTGGCGSLRARNEVF